MAKLLNFLNIFENFFNLILFTCQEQRLDLFLDILFQKT